MAGRRSAICFGVFLGTTQLSSRRQCSQVARQAALSIMANTVVAFNAPRRELLFVLAGIPYQYRYRYWYWYWYWYARGWHVHAAVDPHESSTDALRYGECGWCYWRRRLKARWSTARAHRCGSGDLESRRGLRQRVRTPVPGRSNELEINSCHAVPSYARPSHNPCDDSTLRE
jgi:hypothetical protein